ncbi:hypothetical protein K491DRAFT_697283 [Lophiostoma macrostomum CBS 122681]|uniref:F-box domain-containing protein n=1 Tax=Lophiostoma macrostomum CBS 122681 TaxID=1314788 RepID=A0A6A6SS09_9PLEO|nr:hypothetical protein K491DRAFT_697283 [Lophiostoma macrostomum CBS 122681]
MLDLPNELLAHIADLLENSSSAAALSLTCARLQCVALPSLARSLEFDGFSGSVSIPISWTLTPTTRGYTICYPWDQSGAPVARGMRYRAHRLCQAVMAKAEISGCIKELSFSGFDPMRQMRGKFEQNQLDFSHGEKDHMSKLVETSGLPKPRLWHQRIETSDLETAILLMAVQLQHTLKGLRLDGDFALADLLCAALTRPKSPLLPHLEHIHLPAGNFVSTEVAAHLFQRPRMRSIKLGINSGEHFVWPQIRSTSARFLTFLSLTVEHTEPGMLSNILAAAPSLMHLQYFFVGNIDGPQALRLEERVLQMDLDEFTFALQLISATLVSLIVRIDFTSDATPYVERSLYWGVEGSLRFMIPFPYMEDITLPLVSISQNRTATYYHTSNPVPRNIQHITFTDDGRSHANKIQSLERIEQDFEDLFEDWKNDFPHLKSLTVSAELKSIEETLGRLQLPYTLAAS